MNVRSMRANSQSNPTVCGQSDHCQPLKRGREGATPYDAGYILSGKRVMNPSRFGMRTLGKVLASIASFSPMSLFDARM
jgi:hypothetical protein